VVHGLLSGVRRWQNVIFQLQGGWLTLSLGDSRLLQCGGLGILRFVLEQSYRVTNGMSDFLVSEDVVEFVPSFRLVVLLSESDTFGSDFLEDAVDNSDFIGSASCVSVFLEIGTNYPSKVSVAVVVGKDVSTSTKNVCGLRGEVERKHQKGRHLVLLGLDEVGIFGSGAHVVVFYSLHLLFYEWLVKVNLS